MQLSDFTNLDPRVKSLVKKALEKWNPRVEARIIELFNEGLSQSDVNKIITREGIFEIPTSQTQKSGAPKYDYRGVNLIYQKLLEDGKLDPSITEINKAVSGKYATSREIAIQDKQILDHYLKNQENFKGKPANQIAKSFSSKYGLTTGTNLQKGTAISATTVKRALENAIAGKYPEYDEYFKARPLDEFIVSRHANIFPDVNKLDKLIKKIVRSNDNYLVNESLDLQERMLRLRNDYAKEIGMSINDPKLENNFTARIRKLMNRYGGQNVERYEKALFETIKPPAGYTNSLLHKSLMAITSQAGKMSNKDTALQLGLPLKDVRLLENMGYANDQIARKYNLPKVVKGGTKVSLAGDHTDIKALMRDFGNYKKDFMRIAYIGDSLNTIKASFDKKILALKRLAEQGIEFDEGPKRSNVKYEQVYNKKTGKLIDLRGKKFNPAIHEKRLTGVAEGKRTLGPFSGPLTPAEIKAGGRTIPAAVAKLQKEFFDLSGGYKLGGFDIVDGTVVAPKNFIQPRINERTSPISMTIRETLNNLKYGTKDMKKIPNELLNVVDRAIVGPEGQTTKGRIDILKKFGPEDLKGSGYLQAMKTVGEKGTQQSQKITAIMNKGINEAVRLANVNDGDICSIFGMKRGGLAGGGCGRQMRQALEEAPNETWAKISESGSSKLRNIANSFIQSPLLRKGGKFGAIAAVGAAGAGLVKKFMNDDPTTYLSNEDQQKNMLISMVTDPVVDEPKSDAAILDYQLPAIGAGAVAGTAATAPSTIKAARSRRFGKTPSGYTKTGLKTLGRGLTALGTPAALLATEPLFIGGQIAQGDSLGEIATDPINYLGAAFADPATRFATKGLGPTASKIMRLGISPGALRIASRAFGLPGLALSLGISGYEMYDDYKKKRGMFSEE